MVSNILSRVCRLANSPKAILAVVAALIALQFFAQFYLVMVGSFAQWPYGWDECRYYDYALTYRDCLASGNLSEIAECYRSNPPYSLTLLLTSLPFLPFTDYSLKVMNLHMGVYVIVLDVAIFFLAKRIAHSTWASVLALLLVHGFSEMLFWHFQNGFPAEMVRYQVNFPLSVLVVAGLSLLVEGLYVRRYILWSCMLSVFLALALLLRPPAMPFFLVVLVTPALGMLWFFWKSSQRSKAKALAGALAVTTLLVVPHYAFIWKLALNYSLAAQSNPFWRQDSLAYFLTTSTEQNLVFPVLLGLLLLGSASFCARFWVIYRDCSTHGRIFKNAAMASFVIAWVYVLSFALPTLSPAKNHLLGGAFLILTLTIGSAILIRILPLLQNRGRLKLGTFPGALAKTIVMSILFVSVLVISLRSREVFCSARSWSYYRFTREMEGKVLHTISKLADEWSQSNKGQMATVIGVGNQDKGINLYNTHIRSLLQNEPPSFHFSDLRFATLVFILDADPMIKRIDSAGHMNQAQKEEFIEKLKEGGFSLVEKQDVTEGVSVTYFSRPLTAVNRDEFVPKNGFPGWKLDRDDVR